MGISGSSVERDDAVLIARVADGDTEALRDFYDLHSPWLFARLMRRCNDREVVMDVLQDSFVTVWSDAAKWRGDGLLAAWLWGIAFHKLVSRLRARKEAVLLPDWDESMLEPGGSVEEQVLLGVEYGDLGGAMRRLSPDFRAVVQAVVLDGLTTKEAGRLLGVPQNTVKTRLHRAKAQLRQSIVEGQ